MPSEDEIWVFGYGSLMWDPGFAYLEVQPALLRGYHRAFCVLSQRYRGTPERPGLVLGLDRGGSCRGRAYRVPNDQKGAVFAYLHEREMLHYVYLDVQLPVRLPDRTVVAHTYLADRGHERFKSKLSLEDAAGYILQGVGERGTNVDYLRNTVAHLDALGIVEGALHELLDLVERRL